MAAGSRVRSAGLSSIPLDPAARLRYQREQKDVIQMAAEMFRPRSTDSFEKWLVERCGLYLNPAQRAINDSIIKNRYTAVPSCHSAGKSFFSAAKVGHFIDSHTIGSAFCVTTAPTSAQIESVLWRELQKVHTMAALRGRITRSGYPQWRIGDELIAYGRRPTEIASFQGIHARFVLVVLDEADGIPEELWIAADTLVSSGHARVLAIGNPDSADSHFAQIIRPGSGWNVVRVDGLRTPNMTRAAVSAYPELQQYFRDNRIPYSDESIGYVPSSVRAMWREVLLSPEWVHERMMRWGVTRYLGKDGKARWREPALWLSKVRGVSPTEGSEGVIPLSWVERAMNRWKEWDLAGQPETKANGDSYGREIYGCDVADSGRDETVTSRRIGHIITEMERVSQQDTYTTANRMAGRLQLNANSVAVIDANGIGGGVVNQLRGMRLPVIAFIGSGNDEGMTDITGEFRFNNRRSAAYWHLRELLDPVNGPDDLMLPPIEELKTDLTIPKWTVKTGGVIQVEPKESVVKRLKRSPDCGDCTVMTFWPDSSVAMKHRIYDRQIDINELLEMDSDWAPVSEGPGFGPVERAAERMQKLGREAVLSGTGRKIHSYAASGAWDTEW